ncbi:hypothetical protein [Nonomuraea sp. LPB2021202275-12-8]|uniref:hypothetical protein n=1 Tax=Nonomuraea sp. LPB2021202275-12-8 TaxID=3120159 RepID=UPI00300D08C0
MKIDWGFAMSRAQDADPEVARIHAEVAESCARLLSRAVGSGLIRPEVDIEWARRVYYALIHESATEPDGDPDVMATRLVDTLLRGIGADRGLSGP